MMIEKFEFDMAVPASGPVYEGSVYQNKKLPNIEFNPEKALALLREAGWKDTDGDNILDKVIDGKKTKLSITILEPWEGFVKYLTVFKEDAKKAGVEINIKQMEWSSFIKLLDERKFDAVRLAWTGQFDWDPKQIWHSSSIAGAGSNFIGFSNKEVDRLIDQSRFIHDRAERIKILHQVQEKIVNEYPYVFFSFKLDTLYGHTDRVDRPKDTFEYSLGQEFWSLKAK
jgi:peptide/nickel transport system substrate-binding protein/microcin C transport system substrate-binding protein